MVADEFAGARALAAWKRRVRDAWPRVAVEHVESKGEESPQVGARLSVRVVADLGGLEPGDVAVEAVYGPVDDSDTLVDPSHLELEYDGPAEDGKVRYAGEVPLGRSGAFGYSVRVVPDHPLLSGRAEMGLVALPPAPQGMTNGDLR